MNLIKGKNIIVLNVKTTGLATKAGWDQYYPYTQTQFYDNARIVEVSWIYLENFDGTFDESKINSYLIKPKFPASKWTDKCGVSYQDACNGHKLSEIVTTYGFKKHLDQTDYLVGHNIMFHYNTLASELSRIKGSDKILKRFDELMTHHKYVDTMEYGKNLCKIRLTRSGNFKTPSLYELYTHLYGKDKVMNVSNVFVILECIKYAF